MKWLRSILALGLLALLIGAPVAHALQQAENSDPLDFGGFNGAQEDELETLPLADFFPPMVMDIQFSFDVDMTGSIFNRDTEVETNLEALFEPLYSAEEQFQKKSSEAPVPRANIQLSAVSVEPGAAVVAVAQPENFVFNTGPEELFYAWTLDGVSANGIAAGGDPLTPPEASGPTSIHTRTPEQDSDGDGIDDEWEIRYGFDPNNGGDAGDNPDDDGYVNDVFTNADGEVLNVTPPTAAGEDFGGTNLEEYIFGTDPNVADTDGDGFTDGEDIAGLGQTQVELIIPQEAQPGDEFELTLTILGHSIQQFDRETFLTKVDSTSVIIHVGDGEHVEATISVDNESPYSGQTIRATADLSQTDFHPKLLEYNWFINNVLQQDASGVSKTSLTYTVPQDALPNDVITIAVDARNLQSGQSSFATKEIRVGELLQLHYDPDALVPGQPLTVNGTLLTETSNPEDLVWHWSLDGKEIVEQSGPGKSAFTELLTRSPGDRFEVGLRVTTPDDSETFGDVRAVLEMQTPEVDIVTPTSYPNPGQVVTVTAVPIHFKEAELEYRWSINGQAQDVPLDQDTLDVTAETVDTIITVGVEVTTVGNRPDLATGVEYLSVVKVGSVPPTALVTPPQLSASLIDAFVRRPIVLGIGAATCVALLGIVFVMKRRHA